MTRDLALRLDGMLIAARGSMGEIAHHLNNNLETDEMRKYLKFIGEAMGELVDFSSALHAMYPDITPKELIPPSDD
jgi:hypothetical protein